MTQEYKSILEAKRSLKSNIKFLEKLLEHLKCPDMTLRGRAFFATWCLDQYLSKQFFLDIEEVIKNHILKEGQGNVH